MCNLPLEVKMMLLLSGKKTRAVAAKNCNRVILIKLDVCCIKKIPSKIPPRIHKTRQNLFRMYTSEISFLENKKNMRCFSGS